MDIFLNFRAYYWSTGPNLTQPMDVPCTSVELHCVFEAVIITVNILFSCFVVYAQISRFYICTVITSVCPFPGGDMTSAPKPSRVCGAHLWINHCADCTLGKSNFCFIFRHNKVSSRSVVSMFWCL